MKQHNWKREDPVLFRGKHATMFSVRGKLEIVRVGLYGVRLENGNFAWASRSQIRPRPNDGTVADRILADIDRDNA